MKPLHLAFSLLVLSILLSSVQGIRLATSFESTGSHPMEEGALMSNTNGTPPPTSTITSKKEEEGENKAKNSTSKLKSAAKEGNGGKQEKFHDQYADITEIVEMDYSPARRKTPVHN